MDVDEDVQDEEWEEYPFERKGGRCEK